MKLRIGAIAAAALLVAGVNPSRAQDTVTFGVKGGINVGEIKQTSSDPDEEEEIEFFDSFEKRRIGAVIGGFVNVPLTGTVSFQPEFLYTQKGLKAEGDVGELFEEELLTGSFEQAFDVDEIQIPLLGRLTFPGAAVRPFVIAGPALGFVVRGHQTSEAFDVEFDGEPVDRELLEEVDLIADADFKDDIKTVDVSFIVGGGIQFGKGSVEARYDFGITNLNDGLDEDEVEFRTRTFSVLLGWSWP